jgi:hypothetical protein
MKIPYNANIYSKLLSGNLESDDVKCASAIQEGASVEEEIAIMRSKNQQLEILCNDLKQELSASKSESMRATGVQSGLQMRLNEQDVNVLQMKSEILQLNIAHEQMVKEKADLFGNLDEKLRLINDLKVFECFNLKIEF